MPDWIADPPELLDRWTVAVFSNDRSDHLRPRSRKPSSTEAAQDEVLGTEVAGSPSGGQVFSSGRPAVYLVAHPAKPFDSRAALDPTYVCATNRAFDEQHRPRTET